ncbi:MAG: V-type ATPase subunit, partial [Tetragenococcus koreensis]
MKDLYHTVNPAVRLKETELLTKETFEQLIAAESFEKIRELLNPTVYSKYLTDHFQFHFEESLDEELDKTYQEMIELVPDPTIVWIYTMRYTFHNLKVLTKAEKMQEDYDHLFMPDGFYSIEEVKSAIENGVSGVLPKSIIEAIHDVNQYFEESAILQGIDVIYDRHFLTEQRRLAEALKYPELLQEVIAFIDFNNIITMARCILQNRSQAFMSAVLSDAGSIKKETFLNFTDQSMEEYIAFLGRTDYGRLLEPALQKDKIDFLQLDLIKDNYLTSLYERSQTTAFGPLPLLAFLN